MDSKKWYLSKTIWFGIISGIAAALVPAIPGAATFVSSNISYLGIGWSVIAIVVRVVTKGSIVLVD